MDQNNNLPQAMPVPPTEEQIPPIPEDSFGFLIVHVTTARGVIPLENVKVTVRNYNPEPEEGRGAVLAVLYTDRSGNTERYPLPAPPRELSEHPGNVKSYATYNIDINEDGYYDQYYVNVPIFDGITSVQQADLVPLAQSGRSDSTTPDDRVFRESQNPLL